MGVFARPFALPQPSSTPRRVAAATTAARMEPAAAPAAPRCAQDDSYLRRCCGCSFTAHGCACVSRRSPGAAVCRGSHAALADVSAWQALDVVACCTRQPVYVDTNMRRQAAARGRGSSSVVARQLASACHECTACLECPEAMLCAASRAVSGCRRSRRSWHGPSCSPRAALAVHVRTAARREPHRAAAHSSACVACGLLAGVRRAALQRCFVAPRRRRRAPFCFRERS